MFLSLSSHASLVIATLWLPLVPLPSPSSLLYNRGVHTSLLPLYSPFHRGSLSLLPSILAVKLNGNEMNGRIWGTKLIIDEKEENDLRIKWITVWGGINNWRERRDTVDESNHLYPLNVFVRPLMKMEISFEMSWIRTDITPTINRYSHLLPYSFSHSLTWMLHRAVSYQSWGSSIDPATNSLVTVGQLFRLTFGSFQTLFSFHGWSHSKRDV